MDGLVPWPEADARAYRRAGYWNDRPLGDLARGHDPARIAVATRDTELTYGALNQRADRLAAGLWRLGVASGDRVIVQLPNVVEFACTLIALFRLGAVPVLTLPAHRRAELSFLAAHTEATALVIPDVYRRFDHRELAADLVAVHPSLKHVLVDGDPAGFTRLSDVDAEPRDLAEPDPAGVALLLLSGGTTGTPKLIPRTHNDYGYQMRATATAMNLTAGGAYLAALPAGHNAALGCPGVLGALAVGATAVLADSPSPEEAFELIRRYRVGLTTLMPAFLPLWTDLAADLDADLSGLVIEVGGARLEPDVARRVQPATGARVSRWFGTAEGLLSFTRPDDSPDVCATTEGRPLSPADDIRLLDADGVDVPPGGTGEMVVRGPYTIRGYYRAPDYNAHAFTPDGYYRTGDLVRFDPDGNLVVVGRVKDVINRGGEKVPTGEVEEHLCTHPSVTAAALVPVPDASLGEKSCAVIVARVPVVLADLRAHLSARGLADYKLPDRLELVEELPFTAVGKVDKRALSARLATASGV